MKIEIHNDRLTIFLDGCIDSNNANEIESQIMNALSQNPKASKSQVDVDVEKLDYISSAGLRIFLKIRKQIKKSLSILNASNEIYEIFNVTGFTELLDVHKKMREVSIEGCEFIGAGSFGNVYRLDPETIVKIYKPEFGLEFVEQERNISQKAFLMGVPTAISYDVVKCGDSYGVVYEMLNVKTAEHNGRLRKYYHITNEGLIRIEEFKAVWNEIMAIHSFITREATGNEQT